jgi:signal transduction histidine kinase
MIVIRHILLFILLCKSIAGAFSQDYSIKNYSVEDGLPHSRVVVLSEDSKGYLWIGTYGGGISRFDGRKFESFDESNGLISSVILGVEMDSKNNVWICTPLGISKFDGVKFKNFRGHFERGFFGMDVYEHHDTLYTLTKAGQDWRFGIIHNDSIVGRNYTFGQTERITNLFAFDNNTLYVNLANGDVLKKDERTVRIADSLHVIRFFKSNLGVHALTQDGVFDLSGDRPLARFPGLKAEWIVTDSNLSFGWIWKDGSLRKVSFDGFDWKEDTVELPFQSSYTLIDSDGNSWFGTIGKGLFRFSKLDFINLEPATGSVYSFVKDSKNNTWVGSEHGIFIFSSENKLIRQLDFNDNARNKIYSLTKGVNGEIWAGTQNGLARFTVNASNVQWFTTTNGLNSNQIRSIEMDVSGRLWIAYMNSAGLSIFDGNRNARLSLSDGLQAESVWDLKYSAYEQAMYICTALGVQRYKDGKFQSINIPEFKDKILISLGLYKNKYLLVGSGGSGLAVVDPSASYSILTTQDGLSSNFIYLSDADSSNIIWTGTVRGIDQFLLDDNLKITSLKHFGTQNGLSPNGVNTNAYLFQGESRFFGLTEGAYSFLGTKEPVRTKFPLHLVQVSVNGEVINAGIDSLFFSSQNQFEFRFNKVEKGGSVVRYQYLLENWDRKWINSTGANPVIYGNLLPGSYIFRVKAANPDGVWDDEINFRFEILAPIYQQGWFKVLGLLFIVCFVVALFYIRTRIKVNQVIITERARAEESQKLRKEIGRDFHDEVGNQLARLINYIGLIKMSNSNGQPEILHKMEETSKYLLNGTKDFIWAIDPLHDNLDSLAVHMRDFGEKLLGEKGVDFRFSFIGESSEKLPPGYTRQINLIFKEAMTNVFKHAGAKKVNLEIIHQGKQVQIILTDNGVGLPKENTTYGDGLRNMRSRADKINGNLEISNSVSGGVIVKLLFNL